MTKREAASLAAGPAARMGAWIHAGRSERNQMRNPIRAFALFCATAFALALSACGDDSDSTESTTVADVAAYSQNGSFALVDDAPDGYEDADGEATLDVSGDGTEASLTVSGLEPDTDYISHVHVGGCDQPDPGGPHFRFDLNGAEEPPNEIHLPFTTDSDGNGETTVTNPGQVPEGGAAAIVIHLADESMEMESMGDEEHSDEEHSDEEHSDSEEHEHGGDEKAADGHSHTHSDKLLCAGLS